MKALQKYYFTFGTDDAFPYQRGWVTVRAYNLKQAEGIFTLYFPNKHENTLNCASVYTEEQFKQTKMYQGLPGEYCHAELGLFEKEYPSYSYETELIIIRRDGLDMESTGSIIVRHAEKELDIEDAICAAVTEWIRNTKEGKLAWAYSCHDFNYGDLICTPIPDEYCARHGFVIREYMSENTRHFITDVIHDTILVYDDELEGQ